MNKNMLHDPILDEIHQFRREVAERFNYDVAAIVADAQKRQAESDRPIWHSHSNCERANSTDDNDQ